MTHEIDIAVVGGGPGGLAATMYGSRFNLKVTIFDPFIGGTITKTDIVENYPGFIKLTGQEFADKLRDHAFSYNPTVIKEYVSSIKKVKNFFYIQSGKKKYKAKTVILATGTEWKKLGVKGENFFENKGVHYCALCDGYFYKNKIVVVSGGGDSATKEALLLSGIASKVYIITRRDKIHPEPINYARVKSTKNIEIILNNEVKEIIGEKTVKKLILLNKYCSSYELNTDALFIDVGHIPLSSIARKIGVKINKKGEVITNKQAQTNVLGFYAIGDVADTPFKQAITSASEGCIAAYSAYNYIKDLFNQDQRKL